MDDAKAAIQSSGKPRGATGHHVRRRAAVYEAREELERSGKGRLSSTSAEAEHYSS